LLFDIVRLRPDGERTAILEGAALRARALTLATRLAVQPSPEAVHATALAFRKARGLHKADALSAWCADRGLSPEAFAVLMREEATLDALGTPGVVDARSVADFLRVAEGAELAWTRARLALAMQRHTLDDPSSLRAMWYEATLGRTVPEGSALDDDARRRGFEHADALTQALVRTALDTTSAHAPQLDVGDVLPSCTFTFTTATSLRSDELVGRWWLLQIGGRAHDLDALGVASGIAMHVTEVPHDARWLAVCDLDDHTATLLRGLVRCTLLIDPAGRIAARNDDGDEGALIEARARRRQHATAAPVLVVPDVFEATLCTSLIERWHAATTVDNAISALGGSTHHDDAIKRRRDWILDDGALEAELRRRLSRRAYPALRAAFQFEVADVEGFRVGCYDANDEGRFYAHRDDANAATMHRRFALSVNLCRGAYEGGRLHLPEFEATLDAPTGAAVMYSATLLHEVEAVTRGRRFVLVGFFSGASRV
jgi:predicted 2-oxoglutarate/Fe(II)-dependent dioxygenase YbiX